jgi:hypothetical protein
MSHGVYTVWLSSEAQHACTQKRGIADYLYGKSPSEALPELRRKEAASCEDVMTLISMMARPRKKKKICPHMQSQCLNAVEKIFKGTDRGPFSALIIA